MNRKKILIGLSLTALCTLAYSRGCEIKKQGREQGRKEMKSEIIHSLESELQRIEQKTNYKGNALENEKAIAIQEGLDHAIKYLNSGEFNNIAKYQVEK